MIFVLHKRWLTAFVLCLFATLPHQLRANEAGQTRAAVQDRGYLICGVGIDDIGFSIQQIDGDWAGFDVDFCRAVATAVLGDATAVEFVPLDSLNRLSVLKNGGVDVLFRTTTYNFERDVVKGYEFPAITYYDAQRVLAYADTGASRVADLEGKTICANSGTTSIANIRASIVKMDARIGILEIASQAGRWRAFFGRECDAVTADGSDLTAMMANRPQYRDDFVMLEDEISNEPLGAVIREGDQQWEHIIRWVVNLTLVAEAAGTGQESSDADIDQLNFPASNTLGLVSNWGKEVIRQVGNYEEIFTRNLGEGSELRLPRGLNHLWKNGGLMYPLPMNSP